MRAFKDSAGREWEISITVSSLRRVRDNLKIDLLDPMSGESPLLTQLFLDVILLGDVLYWLCYPQIQSRDLNPDSFGEKIGGGEGRLAYEAFFEELKDFFRLRGRSELVRVIDANLGMVRKGIEAASRMMESRLEPEIDRLLAEAVAKMEGDLSALSIGGPGTTSTNSPASSESTPPR